MKKLRPGEMVQIKTVEELLGVVNEESATERLYIEGNSREQFINILEHNMKPLYDSAYLQGYGLWKLPEQLVI